MDRAFKTKLVIETCANDTLRAELPVMFTELEKCQRSLEGYLEQKRDKFPRFYFVSDAVLLLILSQGSDPLSMNSYYDKVFDSVERVVHSKKDKNIITHMVGYTEVPFYKPVTARGNIEDWLNDVLHEQCRTMKASFSRTPHHVVRRWWTEAPGEAADGRGGAGQGVRGGREKAPHRDPRLLLLLRSGALWRNRGGCADGQCQDLFRGPTGLRGSCGVPVRPPRHSGLPFFPAHPRLPQHHWTNPEQRKVPRPGSTLCCRQKHRRIACGLSCHSCEIVAI